MLPAASHPGPVTLAIADLDRSLAFYRDVIGLVVRHADAGSATLGGPDADVLILEVQPNAVRAARHAGLYHVALLFPSRDELARVFRRVLAAGAPIQGATDHHTHEAIYLPDPDGNGLELACDWPQDDWPSFANADGSSLRLDPLDAEGLLELVAAQEIPTEVADGLRVGHMHLHVGDLAEARTFYRDVIGFDVVFELDTAAFFSVGGYHHHVAVNTWKGVGVGPAPANAVGLRSWTMVTGDPHGVASVAERARSAGAPTGDASTGRGVGVWVDDPWGNRIVVTI